MPLPDLIEIVPLDKPVRAEITVPGSKSITNRALVLAALGHGETTLQGALWSEDTQVMVECLQRLGFWVNVAPDENEACNRTITVLGFGGKIPRGGTEEKPLDLFVGNAGTAARFLAAMVCLGSGAYRLHGVPRMHERPQAALFAALRELGYRIDSPNDKLPVLIHGTGPRPGAKCIVSIEASSQFASALLLGGQVGGWDVEIIGANEDEMPYVSMTRELVKVFPTRREQFQIEPDASSGSYFWAAGESVNVGPKDEELSVRVSHWPQSGWQIDARFPLFFLQLFPVNNQTAMDSFEQKLAERYGPDWISITRQRISQIQTSSEAWTISRQRDLGDSIMTLITVAPTRPRSSVFPDSVCFTDLGRLRLQECERVVALRTELTKCGAKVIEAGDTLEVFPSPLHGAEIETYNDHRMAMCFAILGLKVPGIKIKNPACVKKTFPNFFQKLAAPPPQGLGATILHGHTRQPLGPDELFAD